jgi:manganese efflux pump family protein
MDTPDLLSLIFIALSLSADCFAVALGGGVSVRNLRYIQVFRTGLVFGIAQAIMPVIGWLIGRTIIDFIARFDHWIAFGLLAIVGGRMIWEGFHDKEQKDKSLDITRGMLLITLAFATSIDALAVGLSFAFLNVNILMASLIIGITAFIITNLGFYIGRRAGGLLGQRAKIAGGIILIGIGLRILLSHLLAG